MKPFSVRDITIKERFEAKKRGISYATLATRLYHGWTKERALTELINVNSKRKKKRKVNKR